MSNSIKHFINQFDLQTRLFNNVTEGISDNDSIKRLNANTNHVAWLTGHVASTRYMLAGATEPFPELFQNGKGLQNDAKYPPIKELTKDWNALAEKISNTLQKLPEEALSTQMPQAVPTGNTLADFIAFINHHEAYTIGQIGIARRFFGKQ
ncbi:MAG TPA: DinB family protein [Flavobacteriales bacterium]|nr:DinB family protein [Flavobacteriales bacterium]